VFSTCENQWVEGCVCYLQGWAIDLRVAELVQRLGQADLVEKSMIEG
jgi:hypothetical protein